jgi:hypothetical protein
MNQTFEQISLAAGGSHYPTINSNLQQRFGELIVEQVLALIQAKLDQSSADQASALTELREQILNTFELEWMDPDWDAKTELQKIFDEFEIRNSADDHKV